MRKVSLLLLLGVFLLSCQPEEEDFIDLDLSIKTEIQGSKKKNEANRIRVKNIETLKKLPFPNTRNHKEVLVLGYYEPDDNGGGNFYWDPDSVEKDNGGTIIQRTSEENGRWKRIYGDTINLKWFGAKEDPNFDNSNVLQTVLNLSKETHEVIKINGRYKIDATLYLENIDGLKIYGEKNSEIYTTHVIKLFSSKRNSFVRNLTITGIKFSNYSKSLEAFNDLFYFEEVDLKNIRFLFCQFTAPEINSNALKFINQNGYISESILIQNCQFYDLGRMGIEFQNHNMSDPQIRYRDVNVLESSFVKIGNLSYGMGISLSGEGSDFIAEKNIFSEYSYAGIEIAGCSNNQIKRNNFFGGEGGGIRMSGKIRMFNTKIYNNYNSTFDDGNYLFYNIRDLSLKDNSFKTNGFFMFRDAKDVFFSGGKIESRGTYSVYLENCNDVIFSNISIDNSLAELNFSVIRTQGSSSNIEIHSSELRKGFGGVFYDRIDGADYPVLFNVDLINIEKIEK